jgi:hypothetical protein
MFVGIEDKPAFIRPAEKTPGFATIIEKGCRGDVAVDYKLNNETVLRNLRISDQRAACVHIPLDAL